MHSSNDLWNQGLKKERIEKIDIFLRETISIRGYSRIFFRIRCSCCIETQTKVRIQIRNKYNLCFFLFFLFVLNKNILKK